MAQYELPGGRIRVEVSLGRKVDGRLDRATKVCRSKEEADAVEAELLERKRANHGRSDRMTFAEFVESVFWPQKRELRASTVSGYERDLRLRLMPAFGQLEMTQIDRLRIQRMLSRCPTRKSATNARETLSSIMRLAVELGMIPVNPAGFRYTYPERIERRDRDGVWLSTFAQHRAFLDRVHEIAPGTPEERMFVLALCFGLRKGEVFGVDGEDIDLDAGELRINKTYVSGKGGAHLTPAKTECGLRTVPITGYARARISALGVGEGPWVNLQGRRFNPTTAQRRIQRLIEANPDLPHMTLASCRHSFGTACIRAKIDVKVVSRWMGHSDVMVTYNRYVKPTLDDLKSDASIIDAAFGVWE